MNYELLVEKLMQHYSGEAYADEVSEAKHEFFDRAGILDEASTEFELKMAQFVDWFLFSRPLRRTGKTPVEMALTNGAYPVPAEMTPFYENLKNSIHSLFEFLKVKGEDVYVRDVFTGVKHVIKKSPITAGFTKDELFEARLIPHEESFQFAKSFCFHPSPVTKIILKEVKRIKKLPKEEIEKAKKQLLIRLFKLRYKHEQYKHVDVREVYSPDSKLRI